MEMTNLIKSNFPTKEVQPDKVEKNEYEEKAKESVCGSMVFVDRKNLLWDSKK